MMNRWLAAVAAAAFVLAAVAPAAAQAPTAKQPAKPAAKAWTAPKTPWGDPDIQGVWTSDSVRGIPTQRPAELAGKAELSDAEFKAKVERDNKTRTTAENGRRRLPQRRRLAASIVQPDLARSPSRPTAVSRR